MSLRSAVRDAVRNGLLLALRAGGAFAHSLGMRDGPLRGSRPARPSEISWSDAGPNSPATNLFVLELPNGAVFSDYGVVISSDRFLLTDVSRDLDGRASSSHPALLRHRFPDPRHLSGRVALLSHHAHQRYYHWLFDILPRLDILLASGAGFDKIIVNNRIAYQAESLRLLGIDESRVIDPRIDETLTADILVVPSIPGKIGAPTQRSVQYLRKAFGKHISSSPPSRRLYITRDDALGRRVLNEDRLKPLLDEYGFERISLEGRSVADQVRMFSEADIVVGPHGAGMTNIVFMQPGSRGLLEFMPTTYEYFCFQIICERLPIPYRRLDFPGTGGPHHDMQVSLEDLKVELDRLLG